VARHRRDIRLLVLALLVAAATAYMLARFGARQEAPSPTTAGSSQQVAIGGPFALVDQNGQARTEADLKGRLSLIYFGYTFCPDVCPLALSNMGAAIDALGKKGDAVVPVFVTVDPERDTVARLKEYAQRFHPRLLALTGTPEAVARAAKAYRIYYAKQEGAGADYLMDHSSLIYLMDRDGRYLAHFGPNANPQEIAAKIEGYL
jgi:protein SCO1/2